MIRTLAMIAVAGFLVSAVTLSAAFFITGPSAVAHGAWNFGPNGWGGHWERHIHLGHDEEDGPQITRDIAWTGGDTLRFEVPADVRYTQAAGPAKVTVTGPKDAVDEVEIEGGRVRYAHDGDHEGRLSVVVSAPGVNTFAMESSGRLDIAGYRQDSLTLNLEGDADVKAAGEVKTVKLSISGSADADLAALKAQSARVEIEGSGNAKLAPTDAADVDISGSGDVTLLTNPPRLQTNISGSGHVNHAAVASATGAGTGAGAGAGTGHAGD